MEGLSSVLVGLDGLAVGRGKLRYGVCYVGFYGTT